MNFDSFVLAYLDPGSGSALVGTVIALAGAALYSLKSLLYHFLRKPSPEEQQAQENEDVGLAIFSEGKNYWGTFQEIIEELISRKVHFSYYTMDLHDPALVIDSPYMRSKLFDKNKAASFHKLANIKAKTLLATTPNIGTAGYPLARPKQVAEMVHVFHAFADISAYHIGSLDNYDTVLAVGPQQEKPIREVEKARMLKPKKIVPMGLPYFDALYHKKVNKKDNKDTNSEASTTVPTILIGPSWGAKGLLVEYGTGFICLLADAGFNVIVRPHPQSYIAEVKFIEHCMDETAKYKNVVWDAETIGTKSMLASDLLISDTSSIRFDYAFLYEKPVITLDIPHEKQLEYEGQYMEEIWTDTAAKRLGRVLGHGDIENIVTIVRDVLSSGATTDIRIFRDETIVNLGSSANAIVDWVLHHEY